MAKSTHCEHKCTETLWVSQAPEKGRHHSTTAGGWPAEGRPGGTKVMVAKDQDREEFRLLAIQEQLSCPAVEITHGNSQSSSNFQLSVLTGQQCPVLVPSRERLCGQHFSESLPEGDVMTKASKQML